MKISENWAAVIAILASIALVAGVAISGAPLAAVPSPEFPVEAFFPPILS